MTKIFLKMVASTMYRIMVRASHGKYTVGSAANPIDAPKPVNGIMVSTAIPVKVSRVSGIDARLWIKGIFGVRIMCITKV